jgi:hypothetical protein
MVSFADPTSMNKGPQKMVRERGSKPVAKIIWHYLSEVGHPIDKLDKEEWPISLVNSRIHR